MRTKIIYLHGFGSSPASFKARMLADCFAARGLQADFICPPLSYRPDSAIAQIKQLIEENHPHANITLIGSSLGGYYATFLAELYALRAVLINPAVAPYRLLMDYLGENRYYHPHYHKEETYLFTLEQVTELERLEVEQISQPGRYLVYLQTGDETLDYRNAAHKYQACDLRIEQGGNHSFANFAAVIPEILAFAGVKPELRDPIYSSTES